MVCGDSLSWGRRGRRGACAESVVGHMAVG